MSKSKTFRLKIDTDLTSQVGLQVVGTVQGLRLLYGQYNGFPIYQLENPYRVFIIAKSMNLTMPSFIEIERWLPDPGNNLGLRPHAGQEKHVHQIWWVSENAPQKTGLRSRELSDILLRAPRGGKRIGGVPGAGRKRIDGEELLVKTSLSLPESYIEEIRRLGDGNVSAGTRRLYEEFYLPVATTTTES